MALTKSRGNLFAFVRETWIGLLGICFDECPFC